MLQLQNVAKWYGPKIIFKQVNCTFTAGSVSLLVGSNGAGKSTLMRIMAGLSRPTAGTVTLGKLAENAARAQDGREPRLGYLGHATFLYPALSALENLQFWAKASHWRLKEADLLAVLERVGLAAHVHERAGVFSRGMAQRLNLARVLMQQPDLLLLDEPGTGLDAASLAFLRGEIAAARARGACVILISHDLQGDAPLADRLLALADKKLCYDGPPCDFTGFASTRADNTARTQPAEAGTCSA